MLLGGRLRRGIALGCWGLLLGFGWWGRLLSLVWLGLWRLLLDEVPFGLEGSWGARGSCAHGGAAGCLRGWWGCLLRCGCRLMV